MSPLARMRGPAEGKEVTLYGVRFRYHVESEDSDGRVSVIEVEIPPRTLVKPHEHSREDEFTLVLDGRIGVRLGDQVAQISTGGTLVKPRGVPHAIWNPTDAPVRIAEILSPAGFERYFEEIAPVLAEQQGNRDEFYKVAERYGVRIMDEWIPDLERKYGVTL